MPRLRPAPAATEPENFEAEDHSPPTEDIVIELPGDDNGGATIDLAPAPAAVPVPPPAPAPAPAADDDALQRAVEATRRAEELTRTAQRERDEANRRIAERDEELGRERSEREDAQYNSVLTSIAAEMSTIEKATADYEAAASSGDWKTASKANSELAIASARLDRLEDGKRSFETRREARPAAPEPDQRRAPPAPVAMDFEQKVTALGVPDSAKTWLRAHPEFINDTAQNEKLGGAHTYLTKNRSIEPFSKAYFEALDKEFGFKDDPGGAPAAPSPQPQRRSVPVSAPVSRDAPTATGQRSESPTAVTLTAEERMIARSSFGPINGNKDLTNAEKERLYAQNKAKLIRQRANGQYPGPERN